MYVRSEHTVFVYMSFLGKVIPQSSTMWLHPRAVPVSTALGKRQFNGCLMLLIITMRSEASRYSKLRPERA